LNGRYRRAALTDEIPHPLRGAVVALVAEQPPGSAADTAGPAVEAVTAVAAVADQLGVPARTSSPTQGG